MEEEKFYCDDNLLDNFNGHEGESMFLLESPLPKLIPIKSERSMPDSFGKIQESEKPTTESEEIPQRSSSSRRKQFDKQT